MTAPTTDRPSRGDEGRDDRQCDLVVIGVGNRDRGDDGIGPAIIDELRRRSAPVATVVREGDLADLALLWAGHDDVLVVDACRSGRPIGTVRPVEPDRWTEPPPEVRWSTHGLGVTLAVELARRLDRMPRRLRIVAVEGRTFAPGPLSPEVASALPAIVDEIEEIAQSGWRNGSPG